MSDTPRTYLPLGSEMIPSNNVGYVTIEDFNAEREKVAELKQALSGRTVSCENCNKMAQENAELRKQLGEARIDIGFLSDRCDKAGSASFTNQRDTGQSSNSIVSIAYGRTTLDKQVMPSDWSDLRACNRMWLKLPQHRKTNDAKNAIIRARRIISEEGGEG